MKGIRVLVLLAPLVFLLAGCPLMNTSRGSPVSNTSSPAGSGSASTLTVQTDPMRSQGVLVTGNGTRLDISAVADDGTIVNCVQAVGVTAIGDGSDARSMSHNSSAIIVGMRADGSPGIWAYSSGKVQCVIDQDSGNLTSRLPETAEQNGVFRGAFGWVYNVVATSPDGMLIAGYAINKKGVNLGKLQIDPGTTIGVYWRVSKHPTRPFFLASRAHIIGTFDATKVQSAPRGVRHFIEQALKHALGQLQLLLINYLSSYLIMVDKNGVSFDSGNNVYLVTGTDQNDLPATASIDPKGNITITENPQNSGPVIYAAGSYNNGTGVAACYWANGKLFPLVSDGNYPANATSVFVSGGAVYVSGYYLSAGKNVACYWDPNGKKFDLTTNSTTAIANSIFVSAGTVYTAGFYLNGSTRVASYWKDLAVTNLPSKVSGSASATSIYVSGTTVYVAGADSLDAPPPFACYWTDTGTGPVETQVTSTAPSVANSIFVSGSTVYTAGFDTISSTQTAVYWTGSVETSLGLTNGSASSIFFSNGTPYVVGDYNSSVAFYWNGTETDLLGPGGANASSIGGINAQSVYVSGGTVYVAGYYGSTASTASYWTISGSTITETDLSASPGTAGKATAIFVQ